MSISERALIEAALARIWDELDTLSLPERTSGIVRLRSFLEHRGVTLTRADEELLAQWREGTVLSDELAARFSPMVGKATQRENLDS